MMRYFLMFLLTAVLSPLWALQWPVHVDFLVSSFLREGDPSLVFSDYDSMRPFDNGKILFRYSPSAYGALPDTGGSMLVLEHENGFQSIYTDISREETRNDRDRITSGEYLRSPGGELKSNSCRFTIWDALQSQLVNPLILLPALEDRLPPVLESVVLKGEEGLYTLRDQIRIPAGRYEVYIRAIDRVAEVETLPFSSSLFNLGTLMLERNLDAIVLEQQELKLKDGTSLDSLLKEPGSLFLGELSLTSGQSLFEFSLKDSEGNENQYSYTLQVYR